MKLISLYNISDNSNYKIYTHQAYFNSFNTKTFNLLQEIGQLLCT